MYQQKTIAAINDLSGIGKCSLTAALSVLPAMDVHACPLPTAVLSAQTGFQGFALRDLTDELRRFAAHWAALGVRFDGVFTGFLSSPAQADAIEAFLATFQEPQTLVLVDPVMGDNGVIYPSYTPALCRKVAALVARANVVTPNLTEACALTGRDYGALCALPDGQLFPALHALTAEISAMGPDTVVITGIDRGGRLHNVGRAPGGRTFVISAPRCGGSYSGTGDLFASVLCGGLVRGMDPEAAVRLAADFIAAALQDTVRAGTDRNFGIFYERHLHLLWEAFS